MSNTLATVLDDAGNRALVEKYLLKTFLERKDYDTVLANSQFAQELRIPDSAGQYVEATRKGRFRMPQNVSNANLTADPASGATMSVEKIRVPLEFIQEYVGISTLSAMTSWIDLEEWAKEDLPMSQKRRMHQLTQNAFKVGRFQPGVWAANGTASTAFDTTVEATVSIHGTSFTFAEAPAYFATGRQAFAALQVGDKHTMEDYKRAHNRLALAGAPKINGKYVVVISESVKADLMRDDEYFSAAVHAFGGKGLVEGSLADYAGLHWVLDDEPFTENWGAARVRATNGPIHTSMMFGKGGFGYLRLGGKSSAKPTYKVQDITKTGVEKTIGYTIPFQSCIVNADWCCTLTGPVTESTPNNG